MQMIIWKDRPHANEYLEGPASCQWSFEWTGPFQMIIRINQIPPTKIIFSFKTFHLGLQILGSRFNIMDLSKTKCSCFLTLTNLSPCWQWSPNIISDVRCFVSVLVLLTPHFRFWWLLVGYETLEGLLWHNDESYLIGID